MLKHTAEKIKEIQQLVYGLQRPAFGEVLVLLADDSLKQEFIVKGLSIDGQMDYFQLVYLRSRKRFVYILPEYVSVTPLSFVAFFYTYCLVSLEKSNTDKTEKLQSAVDLYNKQYGQMFRTFTVENALNGFVNALVNVTIQAEREQFIPNYLEETKSPIWLIKTTITIGRHSGAMYHTSYLAQVIPDDQKAIVQKEFEERTLHCVLSILQEKEPNSEAPIHVFH